MGENDQGVAFAGAGEPLLRLDALLETVRLLKARRNGLAFRIVTSGLAGSDAAETLIQSGLVATADQGDQRRETRIQTISVALQADNPNLYTKLVSPPAGLGFADTCGFISTLAEAGVEVECTAVEHPDVNIGATRQLAMALGATQLRVRSFFPPERL